MWGVSLPIACLAALALAFDIPDKIDRKWLSKLLHLLVALPFLVMAFLFLSDTYAYRLVWEHGGADLPLRYRLAALWEGREGPILMWAATMALIGAMTDEVMKGESMACRKKRMAAFHGFSVFLLFLAWSMGTFDAAAAPDAPRSQLNELLQTDLMVIHPPIVFLYYSLCIALSSIVISTLFSSDVEMDGLRHRLLPVARPAMLVGTLGIGLGGLWAYTVLDWGGYWAWDPVETASLLPWLAIVVLLHLPQRPGKTDARWWALAGIMPGALAMMSTLVTRANGVWVSRHAFVGDGSGTIPSDVWNRLMLIRGDIGVGIEVVGYLLLIILTLSTWVAWLIRQELRQEEDGHGLSWNWSIPWMVIPASAILVTLFQPIGEQEVADLFWGGVSGIFISIVGFAPLLSLIEYKKIILERFKNPVNSLMLLGTFAAAFLSGDLIIGALAILMVLPLASKKEAQSSGALLVIPVLFWIFAAWAQIVDIQTSAVGMGVILLPWLILSEEGRSEYGPQSLALLAPSTIGAAFILLTWMLLFASIDSPRFESQELLGSILISIVVLALTVYGWRRNVEKKKQLLFAFGILLASLMLAASAPNSLPGDSADTLSGVFVRGHIAWLLTLPLVMAIPSLSTELGRTGKTLKARVQKFGLKGSSNRWRILGAHTVHLGLLLLLLGHVFTTTLIDRGDAGHRYSLNKDQATIIDDEAFIFRGIDVISMDDSEFEDRFIVGDGYIGAEIDVHEVVDGEIGDLITTLKPGVLRFDSPNGRVTARSEIDSHARYHGDLIVIFDSSQAGGLMSASLMGGLEELNSIRVTIYDLNGSHLVWIGWSLMLLGLALGSATWKKPQSSEEE